ncbi:hypothetical protein CRG98_048822, partial [Punica granatum]
HSAQPGIRPDPSARTAQLPPRPSLLAASAQPLPLRGPTPFAAQFTRAWPNSLELGPAYRSSTLPAGLNCTDRLLP